MFTKRPRITTVPSRYAPVISIQMLVEMKERAGLSTGVWASLAHVDPSYLARLESGSSTHPGRALLIALAVALVNYTSLFDEGDVNRVLKVAGFPPAPRPLPNPRDRWQR